MMDTGTTTANCEENGLPYTYSDAMDWLNH